MYECVCVGVGVLRFCLLFDRDKRFPLVKQLQQIKKKMEMKVRVHSGIDKGIIDSSKALENNGNQTILRLA